MKRAREDCSFCLHRADTGPVPEKVSRAMPTFAEALLGLAWALRNFGICRNQVASYRQVCEYVARRTCSTAAGAISLPYLHGPAQRCIALTYVKRWLLEEAPSWSSVYVLQLVKQAKQVTQNYPHLGWKCPARICCQASRVQFLQISSKTVRCVWTAHMLSKARGRSAATPHTIDTKVAWCPRCAHPGQHLRIPCSKRLVLRVRRIWQCIYQFLGCNYQSRRGSDV